ncbi:hypothetical protein GCK72_022915 [Caenorhabditis remanei]|uniref:F-box associated domain-containing protein n=1 Tax=Caenorhabditis remanei TaxID=31234 RepID=A0A6A5FVI0_CAERE|nr:hypothetical protein GCK72_022915 [Caenorhabditis remanei]KAF1746459.1 hypothetical protein GCK72_022915 [Caenorhabditis remanei]
MEDVDLLRTARCSKRMRVVIKSCGRDIGYSTWTPEQKNRLNLKDIMDLFHLFRESEPEEFQARFQLGIRVSAQLICRLEILPKSIALSPIVEMPVYFKPEIYFDSIQNLDENDTSIEHLNLGSMVPVAKKGVKKFNSYSENQLEGFINAVHYFESIFGCRLIKVCIDGTDTDEFSMNLRNVVEGLNLSNLTMNAWELHNLAKVNRNDLSYILENVNTEALAYVCHSFAPQHNAAEHIQECILLDNITKIRCTRLVLAISNCSHRTIVNFISNWLSEPVLWGKTACVALNEMANMELIFDSLRGNRSGEQLNFNVVHRADKDWQIITRCDKVLNISLLAGKHVVLKC